MRPLIYILTVIAVMGSAFWAYRENYATQAALKDVTSLQSEIADLREALTIQRAEWAYLNRPDRLRELTTINFDSLGLLPLEPEQFGTAAQVAYPAPVLPAITEAVDVSGSLDGTASPATASPASDGVFP